MNIEFDRLDFRLILLDHIKFHDQSHTIFSTIIVGNEYSSKGGQTVPWLTTVNSNLAMTLNALYWR